MSSRWVWTDWIQLDFAQLGSGNELGSFGLRQFSTAWHLYILCVALEDLGRHSVSGPSWIWQFREGISCDSRRRHHVLRGCVFFFKRTPSCRLSSTTCFLDQFDRSYIVVRCRPASSCSIVAQQSVRAGRANYHFEGGTRYNGRIQACN